VTAPEDTTPDELAIVAEDVTVRFRPYLDRSPTFRRSIAQLGKRLAGEVVALDHISFEVMRGEVFGVIGRNGAGKSTLMRVLAQTLKPNEGSVDVRGRTSTLLQLGVGFNPELSGRRNIYLGGLAAGLRKAEIDEKFDAIVDFSELGDAIDRPLKTYSTGMTSRLGFSIAMNLEPDILLLDEVLAVGDESFKDKSVEAMQGVVENSGTIVFVSHNLGTISSFCNRVLWLHQGRIRRIGPARKVVRSYRESIRAPGTKRRRLRPRGESAAREAAVVSIDEERSAS
jgi:ABC-type polysaccharide/polyol phosphate transport system ATPase subunit